MSRELSGMVGRTYLDPGDRATGRNDPPIPVVVTCRWGPGGGPRNVAIQRPDGTTDVIPFPRRLRRITIEEESHAMTDVPAPPTERCPDEQYQEMRRYFAAMPAEDLVLGVNIDGITDAEVEAVRDYYARIAGIVDCFDGIDRIADDPHDPEVPALDYAVGIAPLLDQWWCAIDRLDSDFRADGLGKLSRVGRAALDHEIGCWFLKRQHTLLGIARLVGAPIPQPDVEGHGGYVSTSGDWVGHFGYRPMGEAA